MSRLALLAAASALALGLLSTPPAQAQKVNCSREACQAACNARGGQVRLCGSYCDKQIRERKASGQCK